MLPCSLELGFAVLRAVVAVVVATPRWARGRAQGSPPLPPVPLACPAVPRIAVCSQAAQLRPPPCLQPQPVNVRCRERLNAPGPATNRALQPCLRAHPSHGIRPARHRRRYGPSPADLPPPFNAAWHGRSKEPTRAPLHAPWRYSGEVRAPPPRFWSPAVTLRHPPTWLAAGAHLGHCQWAPMAPLDRVAPVNVADWVQAVTNVWPTPLFSLTKLNNLIS